MSDSNKKISMRDVTSTVSDAVTEHKTVDPNLITDKSVDDRVDFGNVLLNRLTQQQTDVKTIFPKGMPTNGKRVPTPKTKIDVAQSIGGVSNPTSNIPELKAVMSNLTGLQDGALLTIRVPELQPYDRNPRKDPNERFEDIKNSLRESGAKTVTLEVTRRDGDDYFMVAKGGNTRLMALKELWSETYDAKYEEITCIYRAWQGDLVALAAHWIENNLRGDMTFMDQALEMQTLKEELQKHLGVELSQRKFIEEVAKFGVVLSTGKANYMFFTATKLTVLGSQSKRLSYNAIKVIQPLCQQFVKLGEASGLVEADAYDQIINPALRILTESLRLSEARGEDPSIDVDFLERTMVQIASDVFDMKIKEVKKAIGKVAVEETQPTPETLSTTTAVQSSEPAAKAIEARWTYQDPSKKKIVHIKPTGAGIDESLDPPPDDHAGPLLNSETEVQQCQPQQVYNVNPNIMHLIEKYQLMPFFVESNNIPGGAGFYFETNAEMQLNKEQASMFWILLMISQQIAEVECLPESSHFRWLYTQASEEERELFLTMSLGIESMMGASPLFDAVYLIEVFLFEPKLLDVLDEAHDKSGVKWQVT